MKTSSLRFLFALFFATIFAGVSHAKDDAWSIGQVRTFEPKGAAIPAKRVSDRVIMFGWTPEEAKESPALSDSFAKTAEAAERLANNQAVAIAQLLPLLPYHQIDREIPVMGTYEGTSGRAYTVPIGYVLILREKPGATLAEPERK